MVTIISNPWGEASLTASLDCTPERQRAEIADRLEDLLRACTVRVMGGPAPGAGFFVAPGKVLTCMHVIGDVAIATPGGAIAETYDLV